MMSRLVILSLIIVEVFCRPDVSHLLKFKRQQEIHPDGNLIIDSDKVSTNAPDYLPPILTMMITTVAPFVEPEPIFSVPEVIKPELTEEPIERIPEEPFIPQEPETEPDSKPVAPNVEETGYDYQTPTIPILEILQGMYENPIDINNLIDADIKPNDPVDVPKEPEVSLPALEIPSEVEEKPFDPAPVPVATEEPFAQIDDIGSSTSGPDYLPPADIKSPDLGQESKIVTSAPLPEEESDREPFDLIEVVPTKDDCETDHDIIELVPEGEIGNEIKIVSDIDIDNVDKDKVDIIELVPEGENDKIDAPGGLIEIIPIDEAKKNEIEKNGADIIPIIPSFSGPDIAPPTELEIKTPEIEDGSLISNINDLMKPDEYLPPSIDIRNELTEAPFQIVVEDIEDLKEEIVPEVTERINKIAPEVVNTEAQIVAIPELTVGPISEATPEATTQGSIGETVQEATQGPISETVQEITEGPVNEVISEVTEGTISENISEFTVGPTISENIPEVNIGPTSEVVPEIESAPQVIDVVERVNKPDEEEQGYVYEKPSIPFEPKNPQIIPQAPIVPEITPEIVEEPQSFVPEEPESISPVVPEENPAVLEPIAPAVPEETPFEETLIEPEPVLPAEPIVPQIPEEPISQINPQPFVPSHTLESDGYHYSIPSVKFDT